MTVTMLDRAAVTADPGRVDEQRRPKRHIMADWPAKEASQSQMI